MLDIYSEAGWRNAVIYSVIVSCRRRSLDPWEYLSDVLQRLPAMKQSEIASVLPARWKPPFRISEDVRRKGQSATVISNFRSLSLD